MGRNGIDILFLFPPSMKSVFTYNLGVGYLSAYLHEKNFSSFIFLSEETDLKRCIRGILSHNPKIVAFSVLNNNYVTCLLIAQRLKQIVPSILIVFGGPTPTVNHQSILENNPIDICVRGEGEEILFVLMQHLRENHFRMDGTGLKAIKGISYVVNGEVQVNEPANILLKKRHVKNYLDRYPSPYLSGTIPASQADHVGMITARGCNQNCVYCNCAVLYGKHVFTHSVDRILEELRFISRQSPSQNVSIFDDAFTIFPRRAEKICRGIIEQKIDLRLTCTTRCDRISEGLLDIMKEAGFISIAFSLESAVPRILRVLGKVHPAEDVPSDSLEKEKTFLHNLKKMTVHARKIGIRPIRVSIMVGLPSETPEEARQTLGFLEELDLDIYTHNVFSLFEGTPIFPEHEKYGYGLKRFSKNQLFHHTVHPFNVFEIPHARKSIIRKETEDNALDNLNVLGLATKKIHKRPWFDNVIVHSDILSESLIEWFKDNLAFNGKIIQIYSDLEKYKRHLSLNYAALFDQCSPSTQLMVYYHSRETCGENEEWIPGRSEFFKGMPIQVRGIHDALNSLYRESQSEFPMICREFHREDSMEFIRLFKQFGKPDSLMEYLALSGPYPVFATLCRWLPSGVNCSVLETAIIDDRDNIRVCWDGDPVGKIPMSVIEMARNFEEIQTDVMQERGCSGCVQMKNCAKCCFPGPLSVDEYCRIKQEEDILEQAGNLKAYYLFKDLMETVFDEKTHEREE